MADLPPYSSLTSRASIGSLRGAPHPPSPRSSSRHPSLSQQSMADILSAPPHPRQEGGATLRDWRSVKVGELLSQKQLRFVDLETPVESACQMLIDHELSSIPIRSSPNEQSVCGTFDYSDLTAFLLLIMGLYQPEEDEDMSSFEELAKKARAGSAIPVKLVKDLGKKDPFLQVSETEGLSKVVEIFGSGVHRVAVVREGTDQVIGMLSQLRLVSFFWEHGRSFPAIDQLYPHNLRELNMGSGDVISINGDKRVLDALELMNSEGVSSLAVVDNQHNVIGNISTWDVKYLTRSSSMPLLKSSCLHFLSIILTDRGLNDGKDSYPVFYVNSQSTLAHTVAKLVATQAHRMWVVDCPSPASSAPPTPTIPYAVAVPPPSLASLNPPSTFPLSGPLTMGAGSMPGAHLSGRLVGVVSLTDILNLFARSAGLTPVDPNEARRQRRRSSSSSMRASFDQSSRSSIDLRELRESASLAPPEIIFANPVLKPHDVPSFILAEVIKNHDSQEFSPTADLELTIGRLTSQSLSRTLAWRSLSTSGGEEQGGVRSTDVEAANAESAFTAAEAYTNFKHFKSTTGKLGSTIAPHYQPFVLVNHPPSPQNITLELLLASGAHLGHLTSLWNPSNARYIHGIRDGIHILSLEIIAAHLRRAAKVVEGIARNGGTIIFLGTREGQARCVVQAARLAGGFHVFDWWVPGTITNAQKTLEYGLVVEKDMRDRVVSAKPVVDANVIKPDLVVCFSPLEDKVALHECALAGVPTIGIIDTDVDPTRVTYPIPCNDDSLRAVQLVAGILGRAGQAGREARIRAAEMAASP